MRGWTLGDLDKLSARGMRVSIAPIPNRVVIGVKKIPSLNRLRDKAQAEFNLFIRTRDMDKGCISCGATVTEAGHYYSAGHHTALRFSEINTNGQCTRCNCFLSGNLINYRNGLINRYGSKKVDLLDGSVRHERIKKYSRFELENIYKLYREKNAETLCQ